MGWIALLFAGLFEMFGVMMISQWHKDRRVRSLVGLVLGFGASFLLLAIAMRSIPMGVAYAIWTGIGATGGAVLGMILYGESRNRKRILFISLILAAVIGLKLTN